MTTGDRVLVVDDTPSKRYVLASWLRRGGYRVVEAATGVEALGHVHGGGIDLVVLDVRLPDMTGFEVCERIKGDPVRGTMPADRPVIAAAGAAGTLRGDGTVLEYPVRIETFGALRDAVMSFAGTHSLAGRLGDLVLATNELATNVIRHVAGGARCACGTTRTACGARCAMRGRASGMRSGMPTLRPRSRSTAVDCGWSGG